MESPPSYSTHSEVPPLSEDSGLLITSGSFSSDSASGWHHANSEIPESDDEFDERSLSPCDSTERSGRVCGNFFNTVKKGPGKVELTTIDPPPEFQDSPDPGIDGCTSMGAPPIITSKTEPLSSTIIHVPIPIRLVSSGHVGNLKGEPHYEHRLCLNHRFTSPGLLHFSPCRATCSSSRNSLSSRLSSSHNSLTTQLQADDSNFITQAISHDTLSAKTLKITDMYNVPFDSDVYAVPVDMVRPNMRNKPKKHRYNKKRRATAQSTAISYLASEGDHKHKDLRHKESKSKRHSVPSSSSRRSITDSDTEAVQVTVCDVRKYLHTLYSSSSSESDYRITTNKKINSTVTNVGVHSRHNRDPNVSTAIKDTSDLIRSEETNNNNKKPGKKLHIVTNKYKKYKESAAKDILEKSDKPAKKCIVNPGQKTKLSQVRTLSMNLKQSFCNLFRWRKQGPETAVTTECLSVESPPPAVRRALPPLPHNLESLSHSRKAADVALDFATSIEKVKDYGWYWGYISVEVAEKILSNEPDGSFIVRDSSDDRYIFTLTFKLNGLRHVRIEHDQGKFGFGGCTMFRATTIVEFIEKAVETSRSGRYLFFLNLRPAQLGPVRVQLLYPVSRFKRVQSLQHMCRFVILKHVRRDLVRELPVPRRLVDYLSATHYYSELLADV